MTCKTTVSAVLLVLGLTVAACSGDGDANVSPPVETTATSAPTTTATPWAATTKPERPADEQTDASAQAFTEFAADTVLYVMATGDAPALSSISDLSSCDDCRMWDENHQNGKIEKLTVGTGAPTYALVDRPTVTDDVFYKVALTMDIPEGEAVRKDTGKKIDTIDAAKDLPFTADVQWKDGQWVLLRYEMG